MIKVNLIGTGKKAAKAAPRVTKKETILPIVLVLILAVTALGGYLWYSRLTAASADLDARIAAAQAQKAALEAVIKEDQIYEARKVALENRIKVIEGLKRNQVSPVESLDLLSEAIDRTQYVWLSQLDQNNAVFSMSGTGSSLNAIADFVTNLEHTGYFKTINLQNAQDAAGNFNFTLNAEFFQPSAKPATMTGGN